MHFLWLLAKSKALKDMFSKNFLNGKIRIENLKNLYFLKKIVNWSMDHGGKFNSKDSHIEIFR